MKKPKNLSGWILLIFVIFLYVIAALSNTDKVLDALLACLTVLKGIVPILVSVLFLMALLDSIVNIGRIGEYLQSKKGWYGWVLALIGGILSHGPGYVWYPLMQELRNKGIHDGLIITFFYARSIKLPWLPVMISYFGLTFTLILITYTLLGALLQGVAAKYLFGSHSASK